MKVMVIFLLGAVLAACNPYGPNFFTHYHMQAGVDPGSGGSMKKVLYRLESLCLS